MYEPGQHEIVVIFFFYFIPSMVAWYRHHPNVMPIVLLNLFLGWTFIGWVVALVWSATKIKSPASS